MNNSQTDFSDQAKPTKPLKPVAFWQLYKNPIFLRYLRSRMRWGRLSASLILTVVLTTFVFLMVYNGNSWFNPKFDHAISTAEESYRATFLPIFLIQIFIMMFMSRMEKTINMILLMDLMYPMALRPLLLIG